MYNLYPASEGVLANMTLGSLSLLEKGWVDLCPATGSCRPVRPGALRGVQGALLCSVPAVVVRGCVCVHVVVFYAR